MKLVMYEIPIFPLNTVLFPGMPLQLQIFEDRYKVMLQRVLQTNQTFGVCLIRRGEEALGPLPEPYMIGCTARVIKVDAQESGMVNLTVVGDERFKVVHLATVEPYLTGFVESLPLDKPSSIEVARGSQVLRRRLVEYLTMLAQHAAEEPEGEQVEAHLASMQLPDDSLMLINLSAALLQVPAHEKQPMLEAETANELLTVVLRLYRRELALMPDVLAVSDEQASAMALVN
jgi:uncharacterized protein